MTKDFIEAVRAEFTKRLPALLPQFSRVEHVPHRNFVLLYKRRASHGVALFVAIVSPGDRNDFAVEVAWIRGDDFPLSKRCARPFERNGNLKREALTGDGFRTRLDRLWGTHKDYWWREEQRATAEQMMRSFTAVGREATAGKRIGETEEDFRARIVDGMRVLQISPSSPIRTIASLVEEACGKIVGYAVPYFDRVLDAQSQ